MIENEYRYYIYDFLIGQHLLTIDTVGKRSRIDTFNIYGQCSTLDREWDRITKHTINRGTRMRVCALKAAGMRQQASPIYI